MAATAFVVLLLAFPVLLHGVVWDNLSARYRLFQNLPVTKTEAEGQKWTFVIKDSSLNVQIYRTSIQTTHMMLFDNNGFLAGVRFAVPMANIDSQAKKNNVKFTYNYNSIQLFSKQEKNNVFPEAFWYVDILFQHPDNLQKGGRPSLVRGKDQVALGVFVKLNGKWTEISRKESGITAQGFNKHLCYPGMGQHYFYEMTKSTVCDKIQGLFFGYEYGELVMIGVYGFGVISQPNLCEVVNLPVGKLIFSADRPACVDKNLADVGMFSTHIYLVSHAANITCPATG